MRRTKFTAGEETQAGHTGNNQDAHWMHDITLPSDATGPRRTVKVMVVTDGINGHVGGQKASNIAIETIQKEWENTKDESLQNQPIFTRLKRSIQHANDAIHAEALNDPAVRGMGCIIVMGVLDQNRLYLAHVGDSRAYLVRGDTAHLLTLDHVIASHGRSGGTQPSRRLGRAAKVNVDLSHITLRTDNNNTVRSEPETVVEPITLQRGDTVLLCTDGLSRALSDNNIKDIVKQSGSSKNVPRKLIAQARAYGATDDITTLVAHWPDHRLRNFLLLLLMPLIAGLLFIQALSTPAPEQKVVVDLGVGVTMTSVQDEPEDTQNPTSTSDQVTMVSLDTSTSTEAPTLTALPTLTETPIPLDNSNNQPERVLLPKPIPPTSTLTPTYTPIPPTSTLALTDTPIPLTVISIPSSTQTPTQTAPEVPAVDRVSIKYAPLGELPRGRVRFIWEADSAPPDGHAYQLAFWNNNQNPFGLNSAEPNIFSDNTIIDLQKLDKVPGHPLEPNTYKWGICTVDIASKRVIENSCSIGGEYVYKGCSSFGSKDC